MAHRFVIAGLLLFFSTSMDAFHQNLTAKFATKTAYRNIGNFTARLPSGCFPLALDMVIRHGTRYPTEDVIQGMESFLKVFRSDASGTFANQLRGWKCPYSVEQEDNLSDEGNAEMKGLASRVKTNVISLPESGVKFISSRSQRTEASAKAFFQGMGYTGEPSLHIDDKMMKYYKYCSKYLREVKDDVKAEKEYYNFRNISHMKMVINKVKGKLNFSSRFGLDELITIYDICRFETDTNSSLPFSKWCNIFDESDIQFLEYGEDLERYWTKSYGYSINYLQSCPLLKDMLSSLRNSSKSGIRGVFRFGHSGSLIPLVTLLDLIDRKGQVPLRANNYASQGDRTFRTSKISPFAANLGLLLLNCSDARNNAASLHLMPLLNERSVHWNVCGATHCPLNNVTNHFRLCSQETDVCELNGGTSDGAISTSSLLAVLMGGLFLRLF